MASRTFDYFEHFGSLARRSIATQQDASVMGLEEAIDWAIASARKTCELGNKLIFIGNGGSSAIASHMATDYSKNGKLRAMAFNDSATLTCLGNDLGYENVFATQLDWHARPGDLLIAISSSGKSPNILKAVKVARARECSIFTLSGFEADNPLRTMGDVNIHVPSNEYGFVEIIHLSICHCILDFSMGLGRVPAALVTSAA